MTNPACDSGGRHAKHLRKLRGEGEEQARIGSTLPQRSAKAGGENEAENDSSPPLLLAESWDNATDLSGWWMSEKLDGVRAYWDGKQFLSRSISFGARGKSVLDALSCM